MPWWYKRGDQGKYTSPADKKRCEEDLDIYAAQVPDNAFIRSGSFQHENEVNNLRKTLCTPPLWKKSKYAPYRNAKQTKRFKFISTKFRDYLDGNAFDPDGSLTKLATAFHLNQMDRNDPVFRNNYGGTRRRRNRRRSRRR